MSPGIVTELQRDCLDEGKSLISILRKARLIAAKLELTDLSDWIDQETDGYNCSIKEFPYHRKGSGQPKFLNPYRGWCPLRTSTDWIGEQLHTVYLFQPVAELEHMLKNGDETLVISMFAPLEEIVQQQLPTPMQVGIHFSKAQIVKALDFTRNKTLNWTIELEARGILGEGLTFGQADKVVAQSVTNNIYGSNVGVLGEVSGAATNSNFKSVNKISLERVADFVAQTESIIATLPTEQSKNIESLLEQIKNESCKSAPDKSKIQGILKSMRTIAEGASGNIAAMGVIAAIDAII